MSNNIYYFGEDPILRDFAESCDAIKVDKHKLYKMLPNMKNGVILTRGLKHGKVMDLAREYDIDYFYIETGYFGNLTSYYISDTNNLKGKLFHRITKNELQLDKIIPRSSDRLELVDALIKKRYGVPMSKLIRPWKKSGNTILICPPSKKTANYFKIDEEVWLKKTIKKLEKRTDKKIRVRFKPYSRSERLATNTIQDDFDNDVFALVTYNSIAAVEAVIHGVPVFTLAPNAAAPMGLQTLDLINEPIYPDRSMWLRHLAWGQFTGIEVKNGTAWKVLNDKD
jgi:hypothetical protein